MHDKFSHVRDYDSHMCDCGLAHLVKRWKKYRGLQSQSHVWQSKSRGMTADWASLYHVAQLTQSWPFSSWRVFLQNVIRTFLFSSSGVLRMPEDFQIGVSVAW